MNTVGKPNGLPRSFRLIKSAEFGAVLSARKENLIRSRSDFFSLAARKTDNAGGVRFGFTVGKHNAHLSVERALVKRLLRETARKSRTKILATLSEKTYGLDINFRLRAKLPSCHGGNLSKVARRHLLQEDINQLFEFFFTKLASTSK